MRICMAVCFLTCTRLGLLVSCGKQSQIVYVSVKLEKPSCIANLLESVRIFPPYLHTRVDPHMHQGVFALILDLQLGPLLE